MVSAGDKDFDWLRKISPFTIPNPRLANVSRQGFLLAKENQAVYDSKPTAHLYFLRSQAQPLTRKAM
jgi:hypothetical protein